MVLKVGTSSGIYSVARDVELHNTIRKLGYTLTRGVATMQLDLDVAHEVTFTQGQEIRHIAKKQGVQLNMHGDLNVPIEIPERGEWRDAHDRIVKSLRSAVFIGAHYIDFHACLNMWLELITYSGRKLSAAFCDGEGNFISEILYKSPKTRAWFIKKRGDTYMGDIFNRDENVEIRTRINVGQDRWRKEATDAKIRSVLAPLRDRIEKTLREDAIQRLIERDPEARAVYENKELLNSPDPRERATAQRIWKRIQSIRADVDGFIDRQVDAALTRGIPDKTEDPQIDGALKKAYDDLREETSMKNAEIQDNIVDNFLDKKFSDNDVKKRRWESEELRGVVGMLDGYHLMAHYMYFNQDPLWVAMADEYKDVLKRYEYKTDDPQWLENAWRKAETENDREYKEFFYAAVAGKFLEGHLKKAFAWLYGDFIKKEIPSLTKDKKEQEELAHYAKNLIIAFENPEAREPGHAGLFFLFRPKQIYAVVKTLQKTLKTDKVMMILDHEHTATQGMDAVLEMRSDIKTKPDFGKYIIACHANHPNPLHIHFTIELGDVVLYELLYHMVATGFGKDNVGYIIFERGGGQDPYVHSIDALKIMKQFLDTSPPTPVDKLPLEFFGMKGLTAGDVQRQMQIVKDHAWEPLKDLLEIPEEEWTFLSQSAVKKGKRPEVWKRGEFR